MCFLYKRREFITLIGGAAAAWPLAARAQQIAKPVRIGFLGPLRNDPTPISLYQAFLAQLRELGFSEGQNLVAEYQTHNDPRGPFVATIELMRSQPDLVVAAGPEVALQALIGASGSVPIVFIAVNYDPIARGYETSLARPGGNITGVVFQQLELAQKQVEILTQAFPDRTRLAALFDAQTADQFGSAERTAKSLNLQIQALKLEIPSYDFDAAFWSAVAGTAQTVTASPFDRKPRGGRMSHDEQIAKWNRQRGPRVGDWCETKDGGLHRIAGIRAGGIRLASPSGRFSLGSDGVTHSGIFLDYPAIQPSSLVQQPERKPGAIHQPHLTVQCRVFKEG